MNEAQKAFAFDLLIARMIEHRAVLEHMLEKATPAHHGARLTLEQYLAFVEAIRQAAGPKQADALSISHHSAVS